MKTPRSKDHVHWVRARAMRREPSLGEQALWKELKGKKTGFKFRRQVDVGPFILDWYCPELKLCIEVDGEQHNPERDAKRDAYLRDLGIETIRIPSLHLLDMGSDSQVINNLYLAVQKRMREVGGE